MDYWGMTLGERFPNKKDRSARRTRFTIYGLKRRIWHLLGVQPQKILYSRSFAVPFRFLTPHRQGVSLWRVKSSDVRQSKIYKWASGGKGLSRKGSRWLSVLFAVLKLVPLGWGGGVGGREGNANHAHKTGSWFLEGSLFKMFDEHPRPFCVISSPEELPNFISLIKVFKMQEENMKDNGRQCFFESCMV